MTTKFIKRAFTMLSLLAASVASQAQTFTIHVQDQCSGGTALANWPVTIQFPNATHWTGYTDASGNTNMSILFGDPSGTYTCYGGLGSTPTSVSTTKGGSNVTQTFNIAGPYVPRFNLNGFLATDTIPTLGMYASYVPYTACSGGAFNITNLTIYAALATMYQVTVYTANVYGAQGTQLGQITWQSTCPTNIASIMPTATGQLLVVKLEVKNSCGTVRVQNGLVQWNAPTTPIAGFTINGTNAVSGTSCGGSPAELPTFGCPAYSITLANTGSGSSTYNIDLFSYSTCGTYTSVYSSGYVSTFPTDLKNLPGTNGTWLQTHTGNFRVVLTTKNSCGTASSAISGYINVAGAPTASIGLYTTTQVKSTTTFTIGSCVVPATKTIYYDNITPVCGVPTAAGWHFTLEPSNNANAQSVGPTTTLFFINATGGTGSYNYDVTAKTEMWNGTAWVNKNYMGVAEDEGQPTAISLGSLLTDDPAYSYASAFSDPTRTPDGTPFKITFTVTNECGSATASQVIKMNRTSLRTLTFDPTEEATTGTANVEYSVSVYPNPATDQVNFNVNAQAGDVINITLQDIQGRKVVDVKTNATAIDGENVFNADLSHLKPGMYFYRLSINNNLYSGKVIIE